MKIIRRIAKLSSIALAIVMFASCNKSTEGTNAAAPADNAAGNPAAAVIRYIDGDTLMAKYNLAIDINEAMLRRSNQLDNEQMKRGNEINRLGNEIQNKYKNNGYLTEESFNADQNRLAKMQNDAQTYLATPLPHPIPEAARCPERDDAVSDSAQRLGAEFHQGLRQGEGLRCDSLQGFGCVYRREV